MVQCPFKDFQIVISNGGKLANFLDFGALLFGNMLHFDQSDQNWPKIDNILTFEAKSR